LARQIFFQPVYRQFGTLIFKSARLLAFWRVDLAVDAPIGKLARQI